MTFAGGVKKWYIFGIHCIIFSLAGSVNHYPAGSEGAADHHRGELGVHGVPGPGQGAPQAGGHGGGD